MFGFKKKEKYSTYVFNDGSMLVGTDEAIGKLRKIIYRSDELELECKCLKRRIDYLVPVVKSTLLEPVITTLCHDCKHCIHDKYSGEILGCNKNGVCEDFAAKEKES